MKFLTDLMNKVPEPLRKPLWALIVAALVYYAAKIGIPPATNTDTYIAMPAPEPTLFAAQAPTAAATEKVIHPHLRGIINVKAAKEYRKAHPELNMSLQEAVNLMAVVPESAILESAAAKGVRMDNLPQPIRGPPDGSFLAKLFQFLVDHQDQIMAIIKIILELAPLFADNGPPPTPWLHAGLDGPQLPFAVAWAPAFDHSLAA